jgi:CelD/BcsL family acetyltransferase involved in cellulose biosynthesis
VEETSGGRVEIFPGPLQPSPATDAWAAIDRKTADLNPFLSLAWARAWLRSYTDIDDTFIWRELGEEGQTLLPLMNYRGELRSLCYNAADYTGSIRPAEQNAEPVSLALRLISASADTPTILWNVSRGDPLVRALERRGALTELEKAPMHFVELADIRRDPERWIRSAQSRRQAMRDFQRLIRDGASPTFGLAPDALDVDALMRLHTEAWNARGQPGNFADPRRRTFVKRILASGTPVYLSMLTLHGEVLAYRMGFLSRSRFYAWNSGYNVGHRTRGPGSALLVAELLHLAHDSSITAFDFLRGDERYKYSYKSGTSHVYVYRIGK